MSNLTIEAQERLSPNYPPAGTALRGQRIFALILPTLIALCFAQASPAAEADALTLVRIGYQKYGSLNVVKAEGTFDQEMAQRGIKVRWTQFPAGPQLLEGVNVGSIDIGHSGEAPPIFAEAAGTPFVYIGSQPPYPVGEAILVPKDSPIRTVADLKGKKIALNKGSNVHYLLLVMNISDVDMRYYQPDLRF